MQHPDEGTIHSWLDGALSADEFARVEAHVKDCPECATAVAEARGFIAASSRILNALDNAPRGVIPATKPVRRVDPMVWRIAATLLVVAAGSLVVVRDKGKGARFEASRVDTASVVDTANVTDGVMGTVTGVAPSAQIPEAQNPVAARATVSLPTVADNASKTSADLSKVSGAGSRAKAQRPVATELRAEGVGSRQEFAGTGSVQKSENVAAADAAATTSVAAAPAAPPAALPLALSRATRGPEIMRATETDSLRVIGKPMRLGANVTVYEVGTDTVTLTESARTDLQSIAASGAVAQPTGKAVAEQRRVRPLASQSVDTQPMVVPAPPPPAALPDRSRAQDFQAMRTITWSDPVTGNTLSLRGRMSEARLQQIRLRIERERASAAKKTP